VKLEKHLLKGNEHTKPRPSAQINCNVFSHSERILMFFMKSR